MQASRRKRGQVERGKRNSFLSFLIAERARASLSKLILISVYLFIQIKTGGMSFSLARGKKERKRQQVQARTA